jgi:predicted permease
MNVILIIALFFGAGLLARPLLQSIGSVVKWVNTFIIYLALPAIILLKVPLLEFSRAVMLPAGFPWLWMLVSIGMVLWLCRSFAWPRQIEGALLLLVTLGNSSFLGYSLVLAVFGDGALGYAIFYDQLGTFLVLNTFGLTVIALYAPSRDGGVAVSPLMVVKRILTFPPFTALLVAVLIPVHWHTLAIASVMEVLAKLLMPAALFVLGLQFQPRLLPEHKAPLAVAIFLKLIIAPLAAWLYVGAVGISGDARIAAIFLTAMPCMVTPGLLAIHAGIAPRFVATLLGYSTVASFVTLPIVAYLIS